MTKRYVVDQIEEGMAVLDDGNDGLVRSINELPEGAREGTAIVWDGTSFMLDTSEEAAERSRLIKEKFERLKEKKRKANG